MVLSLTAALTGNDEIETTIPKDHAEIFEPQLIPNRQLPLLSRTRRLDAFCFSGNVMRSRS
jgi:hypothetical protein